MVAGSDPLTTKSLSSAPIAVRTPPLRVEGARKSWRGRPAPVLDGVDLELEAGTTAWLRGDNGAGKTTLLRVVCGILAPDAGRVLVAGHDLERSPAEAKRSIGFLAAGSSGLYARLTVVQQLELWARLAWLPRRTRRETIAAAIRRFGLDALARHRLDRISMGERQRVRLAMTFLHSPRLVLLDEPRTSLDAAGLELLDAAARDACAAGGAVLWCSPTGEEPPAGTSRELVVGGGRVTEA
jgi:ABC-2 type transport system ATP-binding protein